MSTVLLCLAMAAMLTSAAELQTVRLAWDPSLDPGVAGYNLYYGPASGNYTNRLSVGLATNAVISNLIPSATYYFVVTAFDLDGLESDPSNEISYTAPGIIPNEPPQISTISNHIVVANGSTPPPIPFIISDLETASSNLTLSARSSNSSLLSTNNIVFGGQAGNRTVKLTPTAGQIGNATVTIYVSDGLATNSAIFQLAVISGVSNPAPALASGTYYGLFYEPDEVHQSSAGFFKLSLSARRSYSGRIQLGAGRYSFSGTVGQSGKVTNTIVRPDAPPLQMELSFGTVDDLDQINGRLTDGHWVAFLSADRARFNTQTNPAPQAGSYTFVFPATSAPTFPAGHSYGSIRIKANGSIRLAGVLADGTKITQATGLSKHGLWPLYVSLYAGKGSLTTWLTFSNQLTSDLEGALTWIKSANPLSRYYSAGFTNESLAIGSSYRAPLTSTAKVLALNDGQIAFSGGQLATNFFNSITLGPGSQVFNWSSNRLTLKFAASTGLFKGIVSNPANNASLAFKGAVLQKLNSGYGFLLLTNQSSQVLITQ